MFDTTSLVLLLTFNVRVQVVIPESEANEPACLYASFAGGLHVGKDTLANETAFEMIPSLTSTFFVLHLYYYSTQPSY